MTPHGPGFRARPAHLALVLLAPVPLLVTLGLFRAAGLAQDLPQVLAGTRWHWFLLVPPVGLLITLAQGLRLKLALDEPRLGVVPSALAVVAGVCVNVVVPGLGGDVYTSWILERRHRVGLTRGLAAMAWNRVLGLMVTLALGLGAVGWVWTRPGGAPLGEGGPAPIWQSAMNGFFALLAVGLASAALFPSLLFTLARAVRRVPASQAARLADGLMDLGSQFQKLRAAGPGANLRLVAAHLLAGLAWSGIPLLGCLALGVGPHPVVLILSYGVFALSSLLVLAFMGNMPLADLVRLAFWTDAMGLTVSQAAVVLLAVKLWEIWDMLLSSVAFFWTTAAVSRGGSPPGIHGEPAGPGEGTR